MIRQDSNLKPF